LSGFAPGKQITCPPAEGQTKRAHKITRANARWSHQQLMRKKIAAEREFSSHCMARRAEHFFVGGLRKKRGWERKPFGNATGTFDHSPEKMRREFVKGLLF